MYVSNSLIGLLIKNINNLVKYCFNNNYGEFA